MREEPDRLVYLDETATTTKMPRLRGRAKGGSPSLFTALRSRKHVKQDRIPP
jgi:hypothetical protein